MDEIQFWLPIVLVILGVVIGLLIIRSEIRKFNGHKTRRGTAPGHGDTVKTILIPGKNLAGTSHAVTIRHTKDPQKHAQAMMPAKARKKD